MAMVLDLVFFIFAGWGFYLGFYRGIIRTVFTILSYTIGLVAAIKFAPPMSQFLESLLSYDNPLMFVAGFLLSFVLIMLGIRALSSTLEGLLETLNLNFINRAAGGVFMAAIMILIYSGLLKFASASNIIDEGTKEESISYGYLIHYPDQVWKVTALLKPTFQDFWDHSVDFLDDVKSLGDETLEKTESDPIIRDIEQ
ncbi:MAG: CvpA family protein [Saprospiraceae bacterium]|nr:CvpA family protein [Saprospiraceae bacterium]